MHSDPAARADAGCPACGRRVRRVPRSLLERVLPSAAGLRRYRCTAGCGWSGLLLPRRRRPGPAPAGLVPGGLAPDGVAPDGLAPTALTPACPAPDDRVPHGRAGSPPRARVLRHAWRPATALLAGVLAVAAVGWSMRKPAAETPVPVGPHLVLRGTHLDGDRLPAAHPLRETVRPELLEDEPGSYTEDAQARLRLRRHCAWGVPGRDPYRGSIEQALQTAQLSPAVVRRIAADVRAGRRADRVVIGSDAIHAVASGRRFDHRRVAMTYGMTLCVDTRVNFAGGHVEQGDLFEAMDEDGRIYAVMVPEVCGNVSVLGERAERGPDGRRLPQPLPLAEVLQRPLERRPRELPAALLYAAAGDTADDPGQDASNPVPTPGTLSLVGMALAVLAWARHRRSRR
jgi:hypothetical protein